jgi:osmotically-inducible protein OsmY
MRRKKLLIAIAALASLGPMQAQAANTSAGDREIAQQIIQRLKTNRESGALKDFTLDMKVDQGVVLFRGNVHGDIQKQLVLDAADGIDGIAQVDDEVEVSPLAKVPATKVPATKVPVTNVPVTKVAAAKVAEPMQPKMAMVESEMTEPAEIETASKAEPSGFSLREALVSEAKVVRSLSREPLPVMAGVVQPATALEESNNDQMIVNSVVSALGRAKNAGQLKGFGVDVQCNDGVLELNGRAASEQQRNTIMRIAERTPGVSSIHESIAIPTAAPSMESTATHTLPAPSIEPVTLQPAQPMPLRDASPSVPAKLASAPIQSSARQPVVNAAPMPQARMMPQASMGQQQPTMQAAPYRMQGQTQAMAAGFGGAPVMGQPVPMAPHAPVGAPRYDSPNLPNYAWPGYAAHPNYAAVTYPQQYSPSAWPYIGPFYPYPQVPLGWRKVSLEWDDGWWFLDFTDR